MATLVKDLYDELAIITGFPLYSNETDSPDTTRFLLQCISLALQNVIDGLYTCNNILERTDTIHTIKDQSLYGVDGIIKTAQIKDNKTGQYKRLNFLYDFDKDTQDANVHTGKPNGYTMLKGQLRLVPIPDDDYEIKLTLSTTNLVWSNNDVSKIGVTSIEDKVMASDEFCNVVVLRAAALIFSRCQNANTSIYNQICQQRMQTMLERDNGTIEDNKVWDRRAGHYNPERGLLG